MSAGEHPDRAGLQTRNMNALVDPARQPRDDDVASLSQAARQSLGESQSRGRSIAGAHDRDRRLAQRLCAAPNSENRRRGIDLLQRRRIVRLAERDEAHPQFTGSDQLFFDFFEGGDADRTLRAPAPRQLRQRLQRRSDAPAIRDERPEGSRAHVLRSREPQPVEALLVGKTRLRFVRHFVSSARFSFRSH
jgi:hypothetical protein